MIDWVDWLYWFIFFKGKDWKKTGRKRRKERLIIQNYHIPVHPQKTIKMHTSQVNIWQSVHMQNTRSKSLKKNKKQPISTLVIASWQHLPTRDQWAHNSCCRVRCSGNSPVWSWPAQKLIWIPKGVHSGVRCAACSLYMALVMWSMKALQEIQSAAEWQHSTPHILFTPKLWIDPGDFQFSVYHPIISLCSPRHHALPSPHIFASHVAAALDFV